ncbi:hypothetical protein [Kitasatospora sp. DSM 101779]|uniref:hypothetical protein n=1 Tax=Kitasatospora sp. DSM 101779 TaxID=2853165 RepID=UPI0021D9E1F2|nr:hypothetical protein [Kitasatospora sp. DSM 101779]MCU7821923.1 hypothetical protein [Kitasatospora sp. DSM 101779]
MPMNRKAAAIGALALAGSVLAGAAPAQAAETPKGDGAKAICKRVPATQARLDKALTRLNGDATVVGSVARLEKRVAEAKSAGHTEVYTYLNDRLDFRKSLVPTLVLRQKDVKAVADWCGKQGSPSAGSK